MKKKILLALVGMSIGGINGAEGMEGEQPLRQWYPFGQRSYDSQTPRQSGSGMPPASQSGFVAPSASQSGPGMPPASQGGGMPPASQSGFGMPPASQSGFVAPSASQSEFGAPSAGQSVFGAPSAGQNGFVAPSASQSRFGMPPAGQSGGMSSASQSGLGGYVRSRAPSTAMRAIQSRLSSSSFGAPEEVVSMYQRGSASRSAPVPGSLEALGVRLTSAFDGYQLPTFMRQEGFHATRNAVAKDVFYILSYGKVADFNQFIDRYGSWLFDLGPNPDMRRATIADMGVGIDRRGLSLFRNYGGIIAVCNQILGEGKKPVTHSRRFAKEYEWNTSIDDSRIGYANRWFLVCALGDAYARIFDPSLPAKFGSEVFGELPTGDINAAKTVLRTMLYVLTIDRYDYGQSEYMERIQYLLGQLK